MKDLQNQDTPVVDTNTCEYCGDPDCKYCINPYIHDINGRDIWQYICTDCYMQLMDAI